MGFTVDVHRTSATNTLTTVVIECDRLFSFMNQLLIQYVEHLQERHFRRDIFYLIGFEATLNLSILLTPYFQRQIHIIMFHLFNFYGYIKPPQRT
ncbi:hypothetical protein D3C87_1988050 [compost metagenome]